MNNLENTIWDCPEAFDPEALAGKFRTPYYLYDAHVLKLRIRSVRTMLDGLVDVFYAVKANPNLALLRAIKGVAGGLDISSGGELQQAMAAGFDPDRISFAGPAKTEDELRASIDTGIGCISVESPRELTLCANLAARLDRRANVLLRVNPLKLNRKFGMKMGGRPLQFGIDEETVHELLPWLEANADRVNFRGIHVYSGSQCFEVEGVVDSVSSTLEIARRIEAASTLRCTTINLGGGFGVSHTEKDKVLPLAELGDALTPILRGFVAESDKPRDLVMELGRYLTAPVGLYVVRVVSAKESRAKTFFMVDGGLHHHLSASGTFGATLRSNFVLRNLTNPDGPVVRCNIAGPSCNPTDLLAVEIDIPQPRVGDLIAVENAGSYGLTASPILFLGRATPAELIYDNGEVMLGRRARTILDFN